MTAAMLPNSACSGAHSSGKVREQRFPECQEGHVGGRKANHNAQGGEREDGLLDRTRESVEGVQDRCSSIHKGLRTTERNSPTLAVASS